MIKPNPDRGGQATIYLQTRNQLRTVLLEPPKRGNIVENENKEGENGLEGERKREKGKRPRRYAARKWLFWDLVIRADPLRSAR